MAVASAVSRLRAQVSVEFILSIAISMLILAIIYAAAFDQLAGIQRLSTLNQVQSALSAVASASDEVYFGGLGARKKIQFSLPADLDSGFIGNATASGFGSGTIYARYNDTSLFANSRANLSGILPLRKGVHSLWVTAVPGGVYVGNLTYEVRKASLYFLLQPSSSASAPIEVWNLDTVSHGYAAGANWSASGASISLSSSSFSLNAGTGTNLTVQADAGASTGIYSGSLTINQSSSGFNWTVPVTVEIRNGGEDD